MSISEYSTQGRIALLLNCAIADLEGILPEHEPSGDRKHPAWKTLADLKKMANELDTDMVLFSWSVEDVQSVRADLNDEQSRQVLEQCYDCHDCNEGINWEVIGINADQLFPVEEEDEA